MYGCFAFGFHSLDVRCNTFVWSFPDFGFELLPVADFVEAMARLFAHLVAVVAVIALAGVDVRHRQRKRV